MDPLTPNRRSATIPNLDDLLQNAEWLRGLSHSLVLDGNEAEDVFQESMQVALTRLGREGTAAELGRPWLAGVARMVMRARRRRAAAGARRSAVVVGESSRPGATSSPLDDLELLDQQRSLIQHIGALPAAQRRVILARFYDGLAPREIAAQVGTSVATVKSQLQRGLASLRVRLDGEYGDRRAWALAFVPLARASEVQTAGGGLLVVSAWATWVNVGAMALVVLGLGALAKGIGKEVLKAPPTVGMGAPDAQLGATVAAPAATPSARMATEAGRSSDFEVAALSAHLPVGPVEDVGDLIVYCVQEGSLLPAPDVLVGLRARADQPTASFSRSQRTGTDGVTRWNAVPEGPYFARTQGVDVVAGVATELVIEVPWSSMARGRVVDWFAQPVVGAVVSESAGARATTDANGRFELHVLPNMAWIKATAKGYQRSDVAVVTSAEQTQREILLTMRRGGASLSGFVRAPDGAAIAGVRVRADEVERFRDERGFDYNLSSAACTTDSTGRFRFEGLVPVSHDVIVRSGPFGSFRRRVTIGQDAAQVLDIALTAPLELPGSVGDTGEVLRGQVVDSAGVPLESWTVIASSPEGVVSIGYTDVEGRFESSREDPWMKDLSVASPRIYGRVVQSFPGLAQLDSPVTLSVETRMGSIRGRVEDRSGGLPDDAQVLLYILRGPYVQSAVSSVRNDFAWTDLPPGEYQVRFQATGRATRKIPVTLGAGEVLELGTMVSSVGGRLEVEGLPPGKPSWALVADGEGAVSDPIELRRGERFLEALPEGPVVVTVLTHGRATRSFETVIERGRTVVHAMDSRPGYVHQVAVTANGCAPMKYTNGGFLVGYSVEDPSGETVVASFLQAAMQPTMDLVPLAAGTYRVRAFTAEGHRGNTLIQVMASGPGEPTPLDLRLPGL